MWDHGFSSHEICLYGVEFVEIVGTQIQLIKGLLEFHSHHIRFCRNETERNQRDGKPGRSSYNGKDSI